MMRVVKCCYCSTRAEICDLMTTQFKNNNKISKAVQTEGKVCACGGGKCIVCVGWGGGGGGGVNG